MQHSHRVRLCFTKSSGCSIAIDLGSWLGSGSGVVLNNGVYEVPPCGRHNPDSVVEIQLGDVHRVEMSQHTCGLQGGVRVTIMVRAGLGLVTGLGQGLSRQLWVIETIIVTVTVRLGCIGCVGVVNESRVTVRCRLRLQRG